MPKSKNRVGYIKEYDLKMNPHLTDKFVYREESFTRTIGARGDKVRSKLFYGSLNYDEIVSNANMMKRNPKLILVREPFLVDDELREKVTKWVEWANKADQKEYDPFAKEDSNE